MRPGFVRARYVSVSMYKQIAHLMDLAAFMLRHRVGISTALAALAIDQVAKLLVIWTLAIGDSWPVGGLFASPTSLTRETRWTYSVGTPRC